jgi:hypothetical protein
MHTQTHSDLHTQAAALFGTGYAGAINWPYELSGINHTLRRTNPDAHAAQLADRDRRAHTLITWATTHQLKPSTSGCCAVWLTKRKSRRCENGLYRTYSRTPACLRPTHRSGWMDHPLYWLHNGIPAAITASPYTNDTTGITQALTLDPRLAHTTGTGWYITGTQHALYRTDLLPGLTLP